MCERSPPRGPRKAAELVGGVGQRLATVEESLLAVLLAHCGSVANESPEVAGVGTVLAPVLAAEVEDLVEGDRGEIESDLLEVGGDDLPHCRHRRHVERVEQRSGSTWLRTHGLESVSRGLGGPAQ